MVIGFKIGCYYRIDIIVIWNKCLKMFLWYDSLYVKMEDMCWNRGDV